MHLVAGLNLRLPAHNAKAEWSSAVHGFGLLLITAMAASGMLYFIQVALGLHSAEPDGMLAMTVHLVLENSAMAYMIAHASLALLQHLVQSMRLSTMWSLGR